MARAPTGQLIERRRSRGIVYAARFRAYGERQYVTLGSSAEGWDRRRAEAELANILADVRRGIWRPAAAPVVEAPPEDPSFHVFASEWVARKQTEGLGARTIEDYRWALEYHLLPFFLDHRLSEITKREVDRYRTHKAGEGVLNASTINKTLTRLASILADAVDYDLIPANPASGRRRRLKASRPKRLWVAPEQLPELLRGATTRSRPLLATLAGAGLRVQEACDLEWRDVNLAKGALRVRESKTEAGVRVVDLPPALAEELREHKARAKKPEPTDRVFLTIRGTAQTRQNVRRRALLPTIEKANKKLAELGIEAIGPVSPHGLRRTYASLREACGDPPSYVARQIGHTDSRFTLNVYVQSSAHRDRLDEAARKAYDEAIEWALMGTSAPVTVLDPVEVEST